MSQHTIKHQQILTMALTAFNQYGDALTLDHLATRLSLSPCDLHSYCNSKSELIRQLVNLILAKLRQLPPALSHPSLAGELRVLLITYQESLTVFSPLALFDLKRHYPDEWGRIMALRTNQWQKIASVFEAGIDSGQLRSVDIHLLQMMVDGILGEPFLQKSSLSATELVEILLFGIARRPVKSIS